MNMKYPDELNRIPERIIKRYLYSQADLVAIEGQNGYLQPVEWVERYLSARQKLEYAENALIKKMHEMVIKVNKEEFGEYVMEKAIFYSRTFSSKGLFPVTQGKLEFLITTKLKGEIRPFIPQQAINVIV